MAKKTKSSKLTYVRITLGFGKNKFGHPRIYRKGYGRNFKEAVNDLIVPSGNNALSKEELAEVKKTLL